MIHVRLLLSLLIFCSVIYIQVQATNIPETTHAVIALENKVDTNTTAQQAFTRLITNTPFAVVKFFLPGCGPCATMKTRFITLSQEFQNRATFVDVNFKLFSPLAQLYKVQSVPTLIYFVNGVEKGRLIGAVTPTVLHTKMKEYFGF